MTDDDKLVKNAAPEKAPRKRRTVEAGAPAPERVAEGGAAEVAAPAKAPRAVARKAPSSQVATDAPKGATKPTAPSATVLHAGAVDAVVAAHHGDAFAVLGPHEVGPGAWEVRAFLPEVRAASLVIGEARTMMARVHPDGFFVARVEGGRPDYRIAVTYHDGNEAVRHDPYRFGTLLDEGTLRAVREVGSDVHFRALGAHPIEAEGVSGVRFAVWAPNAQRVSVVGDFNSWDGRRHPMRLHRDGGVWELFLPGVAVGAHYKFEIRGPGGALEPLKADPVAFGAQMRPETASVVRGLPEPIWSDEAWMASRGKLDPRHAAISIYEVHLGSWMRVPDEGDRFLTYHELAERLIPYVLDMGFTHIELLPITEHPFDGSWGYQPVSLYAPTSRFGTPDDFAHFVDAAHRAGIGILLDWVPGHYPLDAHGLGRFDGTHLYEHADPRQGFHQDWGTYIYNFGRAEVSAYLAANARFWLERYHLDGLRVDAVASMLYLDYSRKHGEWVPNVYGGNENLEAIAFLRRTNEVAYAHAKGAMTIAEESTSWPGVSHPTYTGGLGFGFKWNMGWMHDTLQFMSKETVHRSYHHHDLTFGLLYAFSENFVLPLSHDEVVHGKGSLIDKMPGDAWQKFANLRAYFGFMWGHPGKKLLFMGGEIAQWREWKFDESLDWHLLADKHHKGVQSLIRDLNRAYRSIPSLHEKDTEAAGFQWLVSDDRENNVIAWARRGTNEREAAIVVSNFTAVPRSGYRIGVPLPGFYREVINTDAEVYGGSNVGNQGGVTASDAEAHGQPFSLTLELPPLATLILERKG